jgi:hypothetical protein
LNEDNVFDRAERGLNALNDLDAAWWPFLHLRPAEDERIGSRRAFALALLYGVFGGLLVNAVAAIAGQARDLPPLLFPVGATIAFFLVFRGTFAFSWNRRAARLVGSRSPRSGTGAGADTPEPTDGA